MDEVTAARLLGDDAVGLLQALEDWALSPSDLCSLISEIRPGAEILRDPVARGIIVSQLSPYEAVGLRDALGLPEDGEPFSQLLSASPRVGGRVEERMFSYFAVERPAVEIREVVDDRIAVTPDYALFEYQREAMQRVLKGLERSPRRVMLHMPTGSGKTRTAMTIISELLRRGTRRVIWLASTEELCEQAAAEFVSAWSRVGDRSVSLWRFFGPHDGLPSGSDEGLLIAGVQKLTALTRRTPSKMGMVGQHADLVVFDEAHQSLAPTYLQSVRMFLAASQDSALLGLSATPGRSYDDVVEDEELASVFGRKKVRLDVAGFSSPVQYLIQAGYLARVQFLQVPYSGGEDLSPAELRALRSGLDVPPNVLGRLSSDRARTALILGHAERLAEHHRRLIVFATSVAQAKILAAVLTGRGLSSRFVGAMTPPSERKDAIDWFKSLSAERAALVNFGVLTTGFDAPMTSAVLIARPTKSLVLYNQMVGRAIRGPRVGGNAEAEVRTVVDTRLPGFRDIVESFDNWEDVWQ